MKKIYDHLTVREILIPSEDGSVEALGVWRDLNREHPFSDEDHDFINHDSDNQTYSLGVRNPERFERLREYQGGLMIFRGKDLVLSRVYKSF